MVTCFGVSVDSLVLAGRPRPRFVALDLTGFTFVEPADFGGRPRPFFPTALVDDDDDGSLPFSSKSNVDHSKTKMISVYHEHH